MKNRYNTNKKFYVAQKIVEIFDYLRVRRVNKMTKPEAALLREYYYRDSHEILVKKISLAPHVNLDSEGMKALVGIFLKNPKLAFKPLEDLKEFLEEQKNQNSGNPLTTTVLKDQKLNGTVSGRFSVLKFRKTLSCLQYLESC
jgi:hypothetical protein